MDDKKSESCFLSPISEHFHERINATAADIDAVVLESRAFRHFHLSWHAQGYLQCAIDAWTQGDAVKGFVDIECADWLVEDDRRALDRSTEVSAELAELFADVSTANFLH